MIVHLCRHRRFVENTGADFDDGPFKRLRLEFDQTANHSFRRVVAASIEWLAANVNSCTRLMGAFNGTGESFTSRSIASSQIRRSDESLLWRTCSPVSRARGCKNRTTISNTASCDWLRTRHSVCMRHGSRPLCASLYSCG